jgi:hypothetical protein
MNRNFLLTYSVRASTDIPSDLEKAEKVRNKIAALDCWKKLENVETTFTGTMSITGHSDSDKKSSAKTAVKNEFEPILREFKASFLDVVIYCAIMIESVNEPYEFVIKY